MRTAAIILSAIVLAACQAITKLDELEVKASVQDASSEDAGVDAALNDASADAAPTCVLAEGVECDPVKRCGCAADRHCQVALPDMRPTCVPPGDRPAWSSCHSPSDCQAGQTCDRGSCRSYCQTDRDCDAGACVPAEGPDGRPLETLKVCWKSCELGAADSCADGSACRLTKTPYATAGSFCVAPFDPCPTIEDGVCDEAKGAGACADGTDTKDCSCAPQLQDADCDPIAQCGCAADESCVPVRSKAGGTNAASARCEASGYKKRYAPCAASADCALGLSCDPSLGMCVNACRSDKDCVGGACSKDAGSNASAIGLCRPACSRANNMPCVGDSVCATFDERRQVASITPGNYCWVPLKQGCPTDEICDEPKGTRLCAASTDEEDCCKPPSPDGECEPVSQCGCASKPGTQCRHLPFSATTQCQPIGLAAPWSRCTSPDTNCPPGYACGNGACRKYCATAKDCGGGGNLCVRFNDRNLVVLEGVGACFMACDYAKGDCPPELVCARQNAVVSQCVVPWDPCLVELQSNGVCDDTRPGGSRVCAMGTDPECG